jgi:hypothetical protein
VAATTTALCGSSPRTKDRVTRRCRRTFFAGSEQFPSDEPTHRGLHGTLRNANGLRQFPITDLDHCISTPLFGGQPQIHEEADWSPVMADEVAHEHVDYVIVQCRHSYTSH